MGRILYDEAYHPGSRIRVPLKTIISPIFPPDQRTDHTWMVNLYEKWPLVLYTTDQKSRFSIQLDSNAINEGAYYQNSDNYKNNLSSYNNWLY